MEKGSGYAQKETDRLQRMLEKVSFTVFPFFKFGNKDNYSEIEAVATWHYYIKEKKKKNYDPSSRKYL